MRTRRLGITAALTVGPIAAWRFGQAYKARAGYPHRHAPVDDPADLGLAFEDVTVPSAGMELPGWWIPATMANAGGAKAKRGAAKAPADAAKPGPAVLLIHGWESARDRTLPNV